MTRLAIFNVLCALLSATVWADSYRITAPAGWHEDQALASSVNQASLEGPELDGAQKKVATVAWVRPGTGALYVQSILAHETSDDLVAAAQVELDRLRPRAEATAAAAGTAIEVLGWQQRSEGGIADVTFRFRHPLDETETIVRQLVFADQQGRLRIIRGECVLSTSAPPKQSAACNSALETLELEGSADQRLAISGLRDATAPVAEPETVEPAEDDRDEVAGAGPSGLLYAGPAKKTSGAHYWYFFGGAVVLMLGLFMASRAGSSASAAGANDEGNRDE